MVVSAINGWIDGSRVSDCFWGAFLTGGKRNVTHGYAQQWENARTAHIEFDLLGCFPPPRKSPLEAQ